MNNCNCSAEADILNKYKDVFPAEFIESVRKGVSWLCTHNNITYQTSIMVASDRILYNTAGSSVLRIGLINTDAPLTGLTYYEVKSIEVTRDEISNSVIFNVKMKYNTPMGINIVLVPITYFDPEVTPDVYTKSEIDTIIAKLQTIVDGKADAESTNAVLDTLFNSVDECAKLDSVNALGGSIQTLAEQVAGIKVDNGFVEEVKDRLNGLEETVDTVNRVLDEAEEKYATKVIPTLQKGKSYKAGELVFKPVNGSVRLARVNSNITEYDGNNSFVAPFLDSMSITDYPLIRPFIEGQPLVKASTYLLSKNGLYCSLEDIKNVTETDLEDPSKFIKTITFDKSGNVDLKGYATEDYVNDEIAKVQAGGADLTQYLKVNDAATTYAEKAELAEYAKTVDVEQKIETESETISNIVKINTQNVIKKQNYNKGIFLNTCDYVIHDNKVYSAKIPFMISGEFDTDKDKLFDISSIQNQTVVTAQDVADTLKADQEFKDSVKGEPGKNGTAANKDEVVTALKADDAFKAEVKGADGKSVTVDEVKPVIVEALKGDNEFKESVKGADGKDCGINAKDVEDLKTRVKALENGTGGGSAKDDSKIPVSKTIASSPGKLNVIEVEIPADHELEAVIKSGKGDVDVG